MRLINLMLILVLIPSEWGCARRPPLPDHNAIPASQQLSIDGSWRLASGNTSFIFRIDKGRMYFLEKQKPLPQNSPLLTGLVGSDKVLSPADLSRRPGEVIVQGIQPTSNPWVYDCQAFFYETKKRQFILTSAEIQIKSSNTITLKIFSNPTAGLINELQDSFLRETLDNQTLFEQTLLSAKPITSFGSKASQSSVDSSQKSIPIPRGKMELDGLLSTPAKNNIKQIIEEAKAANGGVVIKYPYDAPNKVVRSLMDLGVETQLDQTITFYEMIINKP
jgi:hypothetical protein